MKTNKEKALEYALESGTYSNIEDLLEYAKKIETYLNDVIEEEAPF